MGIEKKLIHLVERLDREFYTLQKKDREELLRLLSCAISSEEFDDRSTKSAPYASSTDYSQTTTVENDELDNSLRDKTTTKSWIWTSNTIDGEYGMPTRHRRETEDTLIPVSTKSSFKEPSPTTNPSWNKQLTTPKSGSATLTSSSASTSTPISLGTVVTSTKASAARDSEKLQTVSSSVKPMTEKMSNLADSKPDFSRQPQTLGSLANPDPSITEAKINIPSVDNTSTKDTGRKELDKAATIQYKSGTVKNGANLGIGDVRKQIYTTIAPEAVSIRPGDKTNKNNFETSSTTSELITATFKEYPAAVDQGQLLDILDDGTMFDIIELNDTEPVQSESKIKENSASATPTRSTLNQSTSRSTETPTDKNPTTLKDVEKDVSTTTQPPPKELHTTKFPKKYQLSATKKSIKDKELKELNYKPQPEQKTIKEKTHLNKDKDVTLKDIDETPKPDTIITKAEDNKLDSENGFDPATKLEQELTKEFEMMPDIKDTSPKLNRTFRKDVPGETDVFKTLPESPEINILNALNTLADEAGERENIEISFHDETENANITETIVFSSIKRSTNDSSKMEPDIVSILEHVENLDKTLDPNIKIIDPRLKILNQNLPRNNQSELIKPTEIKRTEEWLPRRETEVIINHPDKQRESVDNAAVSKETFLPKSLQKEVEIPPTETTEQLEFTTEEFGPFPSDGPKKMNRHRSLSSKNNRKNFYPYFFSRMLG